MRLDKNSEKLIKLLQSAGYKAYAVGGCIRDGILKRPVGDIDIATSANPFEVKALLEENEIRCVETGLKHGTVTAVLEHMPYEITTFRKDGEYLDNRRPETVEFIDDLKGDLKRRDFTINALAYNENEGVIDLFGGNEDIENKIIRAVGDPDKRFNEDALRIMRALRFSSVLGFAIEEETKKAIFNNKELLLNIADERIYSELKKLLLGDNAENVLFEYREVFAVILPEIKPSFDFPQNSRWHIYDVYTHTVKSVAVSEKKDYLRLALLLHDIGKPFCKTTDEKGQDHFKGHQAISAEMASKALKRFKVSNDTFHKVITLIEYHDCHITLKPSNIKKWLRLFGEELIFDFIDFKIADAVTHNLELTGELIDSLNQVKVKTAEIIRNKEPYKISDLVINGNDLKALGYEGKEISEELEKLVVIVSGDSNCNNKNTLINLAKNDKKKPD